MEIKVFRAGICTAFAPYGYIKKPDNVYHLIPDEEAAEVGSK
jgi:hypothetical protein